jgi:hypothetical protein
MRRYPIGPTALELAQGGGVCGAIFHNGGGSATDMSGRTLRGAEITRYSYN